jgi:glycosyltransferase involved in cell wall biosynthesis
MTTSPISASKLHIGVDARPLNCDHLRGAGKYLFELLDQLASSDEFEWKLFGDRPDLPYHAPAAGLPIELFETRGYRFRSWEQVALPRRARAAGVDLLFCTSMSLPWWQPVPTIVTLHDCMPWTIGAEGWDTRWYRDGLLPRAFAKCAAIITVSETSRRDIVSLWPRLADKIEVIPHGISPAYLLQSPEATANRLEQLAIRSPYLLYMGGSIPRKRLDWALRVYEEIHDEELHFVACGVERSEHERFLAAVGSTRRPRVRFMPFVAEADLPALYQGAVALLYPTLYEGFGFPVIEAQAVGTPVVMSPLGSLAELIGPEVQALPADNLDEWVAVCQRLCDERGRGCEPRARARQWASDFSWQRSAERHAEVFRTAANSSSSQGDTAESTLRRGTPTDGKMATTY